MPGWVHEWREGKAIHSQLPMEKTRKQRQALRQVAAAGPKSLIYTQRNT